MTCSFQLYLNFFPAGKMNGKKEEGKNPSKTSNIESITLLKKNCKQLNFCKTFITNGTKKKIPEQ